MVDKRPIGYEPGKPYVKNKIKLIKNIFPSFLTKDHLKTQNLKM